MAPMIAHMDFSESAEKIKRAKKHINDLNSLLDTFVKSDFYSVAIKTDPAYGAANFLQLEIDASMFPAKDAALIIGDALHHLRSALDLLYYATVIRCGGTPTKWTRFPIRDTRDELITPLESALEKKQITNAVHDLILNQIQPYATGNLTIWPLDEMNIRDKHQLLIPVVKLMRFTDICLNDEQQRPIRLAPVYSDESTSIPLRDLYGKNLTLKDKGHASANILFDIGVPQIGEPIIPALLGIAEDVSNTVDAFEFTLAG